MSRANITIFTIPKPFTGLFQTLQLNAIRSWMEVSDDIILFGDELGTAKISQKYDLKHIPHILKSRYGTPIIADALSHVHRLAKHPILVYVNCDMILMPDLAKSIQAVKFEKYLIVGQRWPLEIDRQIVGSPGWTKKIELLLIAQKSRPVTGGSDYFIYPKSVNFPMPPFAVGRLFWDSWFIWYARSAGIPIVNATASITAIHQQHYQGFETHSYGELNLGEETQENLRLLGRRSFSLKVYDADFLVTKSRLLKPKLNFARIIRRSEISLMLMTQKLPILLPILFTIEKLRQLAVGLRRKLESTTT